jgi:hypothetical protein
MATRGAIARLERRDSEGVPPAFVGAYHHWDSYPTGLGRTLWALYHGHFQKNMEAMLQTLIDDHPAGWSSILTSDFTKAPGFVETCFPVDCAETKITETLAGDEGHDVNGHDGNGCSSGAPGKGASNNGIASTRSALDGACKTAAHSDDTGDEDNCDEGAPAPACYCHGDREDTPWRVTEANAAASGIEWVYAFSPGLMHILSSFTPTGEKMIGMFGCGDPKAGWRTVAIIDLDEDKDEPDWAYIEENAHLVPAKVSPVGTNSVGTAPAKATGEPSAEVSEVASL